MKNAELRERIDPGKLRNALKILKKINPHYTDISDNIDEYIEGLEKEDPEFYEKFIASTNNETNLDCNDDIEVLETCTLCKGSTQHHCQICGKPVCIIGGCTQPIDGDERRVRHIDGDKRCRKKSNKKQNDKNGVNNNEEVENKDSNSYEKEDEENEFNQNDPVQKQKFNEERPTMFVNDFPELDVTTVRRGNDEIDGNISVTVAPGENQIPTNIVHEEHWESKSYPGLFPDGKNDFHEKRDVNISMQQYFQQRLLNKDQRFSNNPSYLFSSFACNEKDVLERNVNIAQKRGKVSGAAIKPLDDPYRVLEKSPGTPIYMRTKKYELIARLENLGPFNLFFTLSCGEKRYNENFTPFLQMFPELIDIEMQYVYDNGREEVLMKNPDTNEWDLMDKVLREKYESKHEIIRQYVLRQTLTFDHRVQEFIKNIMMNKESPFSVKYYSYRVEFQLRGAAHIHGTIWVDFERYFEKQIEEESNGVMKYRIHEKTNSKNELKINDVKERNKVNEKHNANLKNLINNKVNMINKVFDKLRNEELNNESEEDIILIAELKKFANRWISVSLKNPRTKNLVEVLNRHCCTKKSCYKYSKSCRFHYPRFPTLDTIIAIPAKIKYPDEKVRDEKIAQAKTIKEKVKKILENKEEMQEINKTNDDFDEYMENATNVTILEDIIEIYSMKVNKIIDNKLKDYTKLIKEKVLPLIYEEDKEWSDEEFQSSVKEREEEIKKGTKKKCKTNDKYYNVEDIDKAIIKYHQLKENFAIQLLKKQRLNKLLLKADIAGNNDEERLSNYVEALSLSYGAKGYEVLIKRDTDEIFINNYNEEYLLAWDSNMDIQVCLDYFAIITYILDYKMKDESGTLEEVTKALKEDDSDGLRNKLKLVAHTFLTHRKAGESEIMYKLFPFLHFTQSNIGAIWMPTGFRENMSRMLKEVSEEEASNCVDIVNHEGKLFVAKENIYEKYLERDDAIFCIKYTQFVQRYEPCSDPKIENYNYDSEFYDYDENSDYDDSKGSDDEDDDETCDLCKGSTQHKCQICGKPVCIISGCTEYIDGDERRVRHIDGDKRCRIKNVGDKIDDNLKQDLIENEYSNENEDGTNAIYIESIKKLVKRTKPVNNILEDDFIYEYNCNKKKRLPRYISLKSGKWMKLRGKKVLRFHKIKQTSNPHEYYFTEMQRYTSFTSDDDLHPDDFENCLKLYTSKFDEIKYIKSKVLPHLESVTEGREKADEYLAEIGTELDPMNEQTEDIAREEGEHDDDEMAVLDPGTSGIIMDNIETTVDRTYRKIVIEGEEDLQAKVRSLDKEQRIVVDHVVGYARNFRMYEERKNENPKPVPPFLLVHGNAGTGKSHVIDVLSQLLEKTFRRSGDNPDHPYILRLAFTGVAADLISGQTINKTFHLPHSHTIRPLTDKIRDLRRTQLQHLRVIIIDEISLVSADQLHQIHFRLSQDIKQNGLPFGNVALICFGDLLQIKPVSGPFVFSLPSNPVFQLNECQNSIWNKFKPIELKTNHRSGAFHEYAELLNRVRTGEQTDDDIKQMNLRVFARNSKDLPKEAVFCSGENKIIDEYNIINLNKLNGDIYSRKADIFSSNKKEIKSPKVDSSGIIHKTNVPFEVKLKIGARVMLTINLDVADSLCNGSMGEVVGFKRTGNNKIKYIMVKFDKETAGKDRRRTYNFEEFPGATAIDLLEQEFEQGKAYSTTATAINWPLKLSWGVTIHKMQGSTVFNPKAILLDFDCWLRPAMIYVALSRIQSISQLYILERKKTSKYKNNYDKGDKIPTNIMKPWQDAMDELARLKKMDLAKFLWNEPTAFKIVSLNIVSMAKHMGDIQADKDIINADIVLLQETSFASNMNPDAGYDLGPNFMKNFNNQGKGKGVATYYPDNYRVITQYKKDTFQTTTIQSEELVITNVYRSNNASHNFCSELRQLLNNMEDKNHLLMGDFNYCLKNEPKHNVKLLLEKYGYAPINQILHQPPQATQIRGRCLDQAWIKIVSETIKVQDFAVRTCVYSDHEKIEVQLQFL